MRRSSRSLLLFVAMLVAVSAQSQTEPKESKTAGSISGHVTIDGRPAPGIKVTAFSQGRHSQEQSVASAKTDQDGYFKLTNLPSTRYLIVPLAPAYVVPEQTRSERPGNEVSLAEGETIEGLDFRLVRGGVITGRITDEDGLPLTGETITLFQLDAKGQRVPLYSFSIASPYFYFGTDDRGIYRIYGLPPGRYLVSAGRDTEQGGDRVGGSRYHTRTFYPGVSDESKAKIVELTAGAEATGIDIALGRPVKTYSASGSVVDDSTGRPLQNVKIGYGMIHETKTDGGTSRGGWFSTGLTADAKGNFRLDGLTPGSFYVRAMPEAKSGLYSSVVSFQIKEQDVAGLEIRIAHGSSISGVLEVQDARDPGIINKLSQLKLWASVSSPDIISGAGHESWSNDISPEGSFHIAGLHPGKVSLRLSNDSKGFYISRVERGGVAQAQGIEVRSGEHITDVRVMLVHASGRIRGQVKIEDGKLPLGARINIFIRHVTEHSAESSIRLNTHPHTEVDPNGRFVVENLIAGEYEISVYVSPPAPQDGGTFSPLSKASTKRVSVTSGLESEVTLVVRLITKEKDK